MLEPSLLKQYGFLTKFSLITNIIHNRLFHRKPIVLQSKYQDLIKIPYQTIVLFEQNVRYSDLSEC